MNNEETILSNDEEKLFNIIDAGRIDDFIDVLFQLKKPFESNLKILIQTFELDYFLQIKEYSDSEKIKSLNELSRLNTLRPELLSDKFNEKVTSELVKTLAKIATIDRKIKRKHNPNIIAKLTSIASLNPENRTAKNLVKKFLRDFPEVIANACEEDISIKANYIAKSNSKVKGLFNSPQEKNMYLAIRACFPKLFPFPNMSLKQIFDNDLMKSKLSNDKFNFFKQSTMDFVVFEEDMPKHYFELDSSFHDSDDAKRRDKWKDEICKLGGINLIRIRPEHPNQTSVNDFIRIVQTLMNKHIN